MALKSSKGLLDRLCKCHDGNFRRAWELVCKKASVDDADFHDLRRTCITEWLETGMFPHEVQKLAGHADISTAMEYYAGIRDSVISRATGKQEECVGCFCCKSVANAPKGQVWSRESENSTFARL